VRLERIDSSAFAELGADAVAARLRGMVPDGASVADDVRAIIEAVRAEGDVAVARYTRTFDAPDAPERPLRVTPEELDTAITRLPLEVVAGLQVAIANVALVAEAGVHSDGAVTLPQGQRIALREVPVSAAAVYVPAGRAPYPSTVVMGVVCARSAGVVDVSVCAPPGPDGDIDPMILGTCRLCGVERVYRMGGAQAIAALAYGTDAVDRVEVIVGPGNLYVQEAKHQLSRVVGIDGFAGPSDLLVALGPGAAHHDLEVAALDMLAQGEHGEASLVVATSPSEDVCSGLATVLERLVLGRPTVADAAFGIVAVPGPREAITFANAFAPEHVQLIGPELEQLAALVTSAGCVFIGADSGTAFGDYVAGSNHVLPTSGAARFASGLSPRHFRRSMTEVRIGEAAPKLAAAAAPIARAEGFEVHAESMEARTVRENGPT